MMFTILFIAFSFVGVKSFTLERRRHRNRPPSDTVSVGRRAASDGSEGDLLQSLETALDYEGRLPFKVNENEYHCGFVSIIGAANTGKSTLLNAILREDLCVATRRPQTTRHAIMGVITTDTSQLLLVDTPGVIEDPAYKLQEGMMEAVMGAFKDADILLVVTDLFSTPIPDDVLFEKVKRSEKPKIVVINKVDLVEKVNPGANKGEEGRTVTVEEAVAKWRLLLPDSIAILPTFAFEGPENKGVVALRKILLGQDDVPAALRDLGRPIAGMFPHGSITITDQEARALLPISPPLYDEDTLTDRSERFFASEMIRASLFQNLKKELPYCCEVQVTEFKEPSSDSTKQVIRMKATVFVERDSQKVIVIGKGGEVIKKVGMDARKSLEDFFQKQVYLELNVKVDKDWRKNESRLKQLGYLK
jgi:GTP-binding protein Era